LRKRSNKDAEIEISANKLATIVVCLRAYSIDPDIVTFHMADDRFAYGYDAGNIVDGIVERDADTGEYVLVDEDGERFSPQQALSTLVGKKVRMTMVSFDAMEDMAKMYEAAQAAMGKPD
jgi:hypothetical protein